MSQTSTATTEAQDLLATLATHRRFMRFTVQGLSDDQLSARSTVSRLCLGGIVKHLSAVEEGWSRFITDGPVAVGGADAAAMAAHERQFELEDGDTLASLLAHYDTTAAATDALVAEVDLDGSQPLPEAPWFPPGARWTARRVVLHLIAETSQHAGHADIIREAIDGQRTMG